MSAPQDTVGRLRPALPLPLLTQAGSCQQALEAEKGTSCSNTQETHARHPQGKQLHVRYAARRVRPRHQLDSGCLEIKAAVEACNGGAMPPAASRLGCGWGTGNACRGGACCCMCTAVNMFNTQRR